MSSWLFDEAIPQNAVVKYKEKGMYGKHVATDLNKARASDEDVMELGRQNDLTIITPNVKHFVSMPNHLFNNSPGVWAIDIDSNDPDEFVELTDKALKATQLKTKNQRRGKLVIVKKEHAQVKDCKTNTTERYEYKR